MPGLQSRVIQKGECPQFGRDPGGYILWVFADINSFQRKIMKDFNDSVETRYAGHRPSFIDIVASILEKEMSVCVKQFEWDIRNKESVIGNESAIRQRAETCKNESLLLAVKKIAQV